MNNTMNVQETLDILYQLCKEDAVLRRRLLASRQSANPVAEFCRISAEYGYPISVMDLVMAGEEAYAEMARSTNGGGENHPRIQNADDLYELFLGSIE